MPNPLNGFKRMMTNFDIYRNSDLIATEKGLKNTEQGTNKKYVGFYPNVDIKIGDILQNPNSDFKYYIFDIDTAFYKGEIYQIKAYYQSNPPSSQSSSSTIFNIESASNSVIGTQQSAVINNSNFNIDDLKQLIELYGNEDKQQLYELSSQLQNLLNNDDFHKSKLSRFSDLIAKHSWLPVAIAQLLSAYLQSH